ncbi:MAG: hypothetical protein N838_22550 [Thiohalocapsa sp. PB-PSB1]|jgi:hypothetical protein|nr:MAG: hypothetical protein N838_22550 [Thiohalocapsa sp. PB-PSB1]
MLPAMLSSGPAWRWPMYAGEPDVDAGPAPIANTSWLLRSVLAASYIEWRYYAILSDALHGIVGLALVNPQQRFGSIAESGLLVILAGNLKQPTKSVNPPAGNEPQNLCWMHLFPVAACRFDQPEVGSLIAADQHCRLTLRQQGPAEIHLRLELDPGLRLELTHAGLAGTAIEPVMGDDLGRLPGCHWVVHCPSPVALTGGEIQLGPGFDAALSRANQSGAIASATPALLDMTRTGPTVFRWQRASGYYEHSFGIQPLPLHGWDFLFIPDALHGQSVVMQTYRGSRQLRYLEVCWRDGDQPRVQRFDAAQLSLEWAEQKYDPLLGVTRPLRRRIRAEAPGLRLQVDNRVLDRIPLLRLRRLAVRHFFISEEIGVADWTLDDGQGRIIAMARNQPCGGELAHFRWRLGKTCLGKT